MHRGGFVSEDEIQRAFDRVASSGRAASARREIAASRKEWVERKRAIRQFLGRTLGLDPMPPKGPLSARAHGVADRRDFRIERVSFEPRPECLVTALVYEPKNATLPAPCVLIFPDYASPAGKSAPDMQALAGGLCRLGLIAMVVDPFFAGERKAATLEASAFGLLPAGLCWAETGVWEGIRALDYASALKHVNPSAIVLLGVGGGTRDALLVSALDGREKLCIAVNGLAPNSALLRQLAAAPSASRRMWLESPLCVPGIAAEAEMAEIITSLSRPVLVVNSPEATGFSRQEAAELTAGANAGSRVAGWPECTLRNATGAALCGPDSRAQVYAWLASMLALQASAPDSEGAPEAASATDLTCFPDSRGLDTTAALAALTRRRAERTPEPKPLARQKKAADAQMAQMRAAIASRLRLPAAPQAARLEETPDGEAVVHTTSGTVRLHLTRPEHGGSGGLAVVPVTDPSQDTAALCTALTDAGLTAARVYVRPQIPPAAPAGWNLAAAALAVCHPLLGWQTQDLLAALQALADAEPDRRIGICAQGYAALPALMAAATGSIHSAVAVSGCILTFRRLLAGAQSAPPAAYVHGMLAAADIAWAAALSCPKPLRIASPVDAAQRLLPRHTSGEEVEPIRAAYRLPGRGEQFVLAPDLEPPQKAAAWLAAQLRPRTARHGAARRH